MTEHLKADTEKTVASGWQIGQFTRYFSKGITCVQNGQCWQEILSSPVLNEAPPPSTTPSIPPQPILKSDVSGKKEWLNWYLVGSLFGVLCPFSNCITLWYIILLLHHLIVASDSLFELEKISLSAEAAIMPHMHIRCFFFLWSKKSSWICGFILIKTIPLLCNAVLAGREHNLAVCTWSKGCVMDTHDPTNQYFTILLNNTLILQLLSHHINLSQTLLIIDTCNCTF